MSFMKPDYIETDYIVFNAGDDFIIPADDYTDDMGEIMERGHGVLWRLSAPGYMDCTDWSVEESMDEARSACMRAFDVCPECGADLPDDDRTDCAECETEFPSN